MSKNTKVETYALMILAQDTARRMIRAIDRIMAGETESSVCKSENLEIHWFRRFVRQDSTIKGISDFKRERLEKHVFVSKQDWYCWQDSFLRALMGEDWYAPEGFDEIYEECVESACTQREREILEKYFKDERTLEDIAKDYNITREGVRSSQVHALRKLRHPKYRLLLVYGRDYKNALEETTTTQEEYDKACLTHYNKCIEEKNKMVEKQKKLTREIRGKIAAMGTLSEDEFLNTVCLYDDMPIEEMNLSVRSYNRLKNNHKSFKINEGSEIKGPIDTVGKLCRLTKEDVNSISRIGVKCVAEIEKILLEDYGIVMRRSNNEKGENDHVNDEHTGD